MTDLPPSPPRRGVRIALVLSLLVNLVFVGLVIGAVVGHHDDGDDGRRGGPDLGFGPYFGALPDAAKAEIKTTLKGQAGDLKQNRQQLKQEFQAMLAGLRADPYDPQAVALAFDAQQKVFQDRTRMGRDILLDRIGAMSVAERRAFADRLEDKIRHKRPSRD